MNITNINSNRYEVFTWVEFNNLVFVLDKDAGVVFIAIPFCDTGFAPVAFKSFHLEFVSGLLYWDNIYVGILQKLNFSVSAWIDAFNVPVTYSDIGGSSYQQSRYAADGESFVECLPIIVFMFGVGQFLYEENVVFPLWVL